MMETKKKRNLDILSLPGIKFRHLKLHKSGDTFFDVRVECDFEHLDLENKPLNLKGQVLSSIKVGTVKSPNGFGTLKYSPFFLKYFPHYKDRLIFVTKQGIFEQNSAAKDTSANHNLLFAFDNIIVMSRGKKLRFNAPEQDNKVNQEQNFSSSHSNESSKTIDPKNVLAEQVSLNQEESLQGKAKGSSASGASVQIKENTAQSETKTLENVEVVPSVSQITSYSDEDDIGVLSGNSPKTNTVYHTYKEGIKTNASQNSHIEDRVPNNNLKSTYSSSADRSVDVMPMATTCTYNGRPALRMSDSAMVVHSLNQDDTITNPTVEQNSQDINSGEDYNSQNDALASNVEDSKFSDKDRYYMNVALELAKESALQGEVPVGAIIVDSQGNIVGSGYNQTITNNDPTAHAEVIALRDAGKRLGNYRLNECVMYVTLEPCCMCAMAVVHARLNEVVFGAYDPKTGACGSMMHLMYDYKHNHKVLVRGGVMKEQCASVLSQFFARRREEKKAAKQAKTNQAIVQN